MFVQLVLISSCIVVNFPTEGMSASQILTIGQRLLGDEMIENREDSRRGSPDQPVSLSKTYAGNNIYLITQVVIEDLAMQDGFAAIIAGGPGHTFVSLAYSIPRYSHMRYNITLYGKQPGYRKIL